MIHVPLPAQGRARCLYDEQAQRQHQEKMLFRALRNPEPAAETPAAKPAFFAAGIGR
jgi:hypothetical protein